MEARSELKVAVIGAGSQLVQMSEAGGHSDRNQEDKGTSLPIQSQLRQIEVDWSSLLADVPVVQQALHKVRRFNT